jgi:nucleotide-binding universal stress UspA family protein
MESLAGDYSMTADPTLLVPLDGSEGALSALPVARSLAQIMGASVMLIHVGREALSPGELLNSLKLSHEEAHGLIIEQSTGSPAHGIVEAAIERRTMLIVMCAPTRSLAPAYPFAGVVGGVLKKAPCPVVLVPSTRGRRSWGLTQLVLPHDGTPTSAAAIAPTADLAKRAGAELVVVHVAEPGACKPAEPGTIVAPRYLDQPHHEWPSWAREFLGRVSYACHPGNMQRIRLVLTHGETSASILEFAHKNGSDLIALAWRGAFEPARAQTMRRVIRDAHCPVIVFRVQP